ncbi:hypothetical protein LCGC14_1746590, partial [marine sediment metagenome]
LHLKEKIVKHRKSFLTYILICFLAVLVPSLILWDTITANLSFLHSDPFYWFAEVLHLSNEMQILNFLAVYPPGFEYFVTSSVNLLIFPDYKIIYYFIKFAPIPLFSFYLLIVAVIVKRVFKKKSLILFSLIATLSSTYLIRRFIVFVPGNLATIIFLISLLVFVTNCPFYLQAFFLALIFLLNPIVAFFYFFGIALYVLIKFLKKEVNLKVILRNSVNFSIIAGILILPFIVLLYIYGKNIIISFLNFGFQLEFWEIPPPNNQINLINLFLTSKGFITGWIKDTPPWVINDFINNQIIFSWLFIFAGISLFLSTKSMSIKKYKNLHYFGKGIVIIILILFFFPILLPFNPLNNIIPFNITIRILECFAAPIILMECFGVDYIIRKIEILSSYFSKKVNNTSILNNRKSVLKNTFIILLLISGYSLYIFDVDYYRRKGYKYEATQIEVLFFIRDNLSPSDTILAPNFSHNLGFNRLYNLIYDFNYSLWDYSIENSYNKTKEYLNQNNLKYMLIDIESINEEQLNYFIINEDNFKPIFENTRNILFEINGDLGGFKPTGIFEATWNFLSEKEENIGYDIDFIDWYHTIKETYASITLNVDNHYKVLDFFNDEIGSKLIVYNNLGTKNKAGHQEDSGTIEFWWRTENSSQESMFSLYESSITGINIKIFDGNFNYYNGSNWINITTALNNKWYHLQIDFECGNNSYQGLFSNSYNLYINGIKELGNINYSSYINQFTKFRLQTYQIQTSFHTYFDAFGYSWGEEYNVGDNLHEIFL